MFIDLETDTDSGRLASEFLSRAGFTGIDYPAEYSTGGRADGARNYVIFNEADLKITAHERFRFIGEKGLPTLTGLKESVRVWKTLQWPAKWKSQARMPEQ